LAVEFGTFPKVLYDALTIHSERDYKSYAVLID
jgi:hypothetical protein